MDVDDIPTPQEIKDYLDEYVITQEYAKEILRNSEVFIGANNLFNQEYYDNIRINAFGKRYYEPAPKRNLYFGINLSF